jgi:hypothetical protein
MKAWLVSRNDEWCSTVVFAITRGKAKSYALRTESFEDVDFCELYVRRVKKMDKYYVEGKKEMDWFNSKDRIALVKDCGFRCCDEAFDIEVCKHCPAKEYCDYYQDRKTDEEMGCGE